MVPAVSQASLHLPLGAGEQDGRYHDQGSAKHLIGRTEQEASESVIDLIGGELVPGICSELLPG